MKDTAIYKLYDLNYQKNTKNPLNLPLHVFAHRTSKRALELITLNASNVVELHCVQNTIKFRKLFGQVFKKSLCFEADIKAPRYITTS